MSGQSGCRVSLAATAAAAAALCVATAGLGAQQRAGDTACRVTGRITGLGTPLPGVSITARRGPVVHTATSTSADGTYRLALAPDTYQLTIEMAGFERIEREITLAESACQQTLDLILTLQSRAAPEAGPAADPVAGRVGGRGGRAGGPAVFAGRGAGRGGGFEALEVTADEAGTAVVELADPELSLDDVPLLLPPGFGSEASADAISIMGDSARVDRGMLNDRLNALARGDFALLAAEFADAAGAFGAFAGPPGGGPIAIAGGAREGGPGGRGAGPAGGFVLGGRGGRGRSIQATADYTFGGSALNAAPYSLRSDAPREERPFTRQTFGGTVGGPLRLPAIYDGRNRTNFTLQYNGGIGSNLFDQYATVPTAAMRAGDFSGASVALIDPVTGLAFPGNQIPLDRLSPQSLALLRYIPEPNLPGATRNYRYTTTTASVNNSVSLRVNHNFSAGAGAAGRGGRGGGRAGGVGRAGGAGRGRGTATIVTMNVQVQYRESHGDQNNVFATLGGRTESSTLSAPVSLNISRGRDQHAITTSLSRTSSGTRNQFTEAFNPSGDAGITGISSDPFAWGLPALSFSSITGLRDATPSRRRDTRVAAGYTWTRPRGRHTVRAGGDFRYDRGSSHAESNANGSFVFTGLYTSGGAPARGAYDVADFLLGMPQQASVQYGPGEVALTGRSMSLFLQDDWRARGSVTVNLGVRYELLWPFVERGGQLVNLDVTPDFTAAAPVLAGSTGAFTGAFPPALLLTDRNNVAPRVGMAWRGPRNLIVRGGYGVSYNAGSYTAIARQLAAQPPFAVTNTRIGALNAALLMEDALSGGSLNETTNTFGVEKDYVLGRVQTWNVDVMRNLGVSWSAGANYTHTRGSSLDIVRAPNRDAGGLRIEGVQPFTWQSAEGRSLLDSASFRLQRRPVRGLGGQITYTLARSRDNAPSIGGGGGASVVAQNDQDLDAEWGLSNFDRRHRFSASVNVELPFGPNRVWLTNGGVWARLLENWRMSATVNADSGTPLTPRVRGASRDVAQGLNGALRADYDGAPIQVANPTIDQFFNTTAFALPPTGLFGTSPRNVIIGPGSRQLDAQVARDVRLGDTRALSIQLRATNLLNLVNYANVDTFVNSPTFGQILSVRPMRSAQLNLRFRF